MSATLSDEDLVRYPARPRRSRAAGDVARPGRDASSRVDAVRRRRVGRGLGRRAVGVRSPSSPVSRSARIPLLAPQPVATQARLGRSAPRPPSRSPAEHLGRQRADRAGPHRTAIVARPEPVRQARHPQPHGRADLPGGRAGPRRPSRRPRRRRRSRARDGLRRRGRLVARHGRHGDVEHGRGRRRQGAVPGGAAGRLRCSPSPRAATGGASSRSSWETYRPVSTNPRVFVTYPQRCRRGRRRRRRRAQPPPSRSPPSGLPARTPGCSTRSDETVIRHQRHRARRATGAPAFPTFVGADGTTVRGRRAAAGLCECLRGAAADGTVLRAAIESVAGRTDAGPGAPRSGGLRACVRQAPTRCCAR